MYAGIQRCMSGVNIGGPWSITNFVLAPKCRDVVPGSGNNRRDRLSSPKLVRGMAKLDL